MFENIMVPMDGSPCSYMALEKAVALQKLCGPNSKIRIVNVYRHQGQMESSVSMVRAMTPETIDTAMSSYAKDVVQAAKTRAIEMGSVNVSAHVLSGPTARTIVKFAEERKADLIIIGGRGHGDLEALLLGSVSHKVTSLAHCPVMVVR
ncbi:universal stress protein [uncultured Cohaesibacter sp.]|uniref:universal stress protein n=1 Tax=uncultured Cohaesibacter sp. TaxID=1002546 RepID=UPI0029C6620B|nr:universal stress protein [uncultured Cohaesibacter sp.]